MGKDFLEKVEKELERWEKSFDKSKIENILNDSGIPIKLLYAPNDFEFERYLENIGFPGEYPFTRGIHPTMYRQRIWTMRQYSGYGTPDETNKRFKYLISQGQTGLSVAFDLPTQLGYDSDHPLSVGEVGRVGVCVDTLEDMERIFKDIPLSKVSTSMTINAPTAILLAMYLAVAKKQGVPFKELRGTVQNDILKEYTVRGTYIFPPDPSLRLITDIFSFCKEHVPKWNTINIAGYHMREAGASAAQEIGFTFSNGITYVKAGIEAGLSVDDFAPRISWIFNTGSNFFEEIAKYRAARRIWAKIMKDRFLAKNKRSLMLRFHTQTAGWTLTATQPLNNIVRVAIQTLAAVLSGCQSLASCSFDEALSLPSEEAVKLSLRTQQIIAYETHVTDTVDPLGGSYYIESLTDEMEKKIWEYIDKIDRLGGAVKAIEVGYIQKEIQENAYKIQKDIESGRRPVVGVNMFCEEEEPKETPFKVDPKIAEVQIKRLSEIKRKRDKREVLKSLGELKAAAKSDKNLMPYIYRACLAYATIGEICDVLREVFGEYRPPSTF